MRRAVGWLLGPVPVPRLLYALLITLAVLVPSTDRVADAVGWGWVYLILGVASVALGLDLWRLRRARAERSRA